MAASEGLVTGRTTIKEFAKLWVFTAPAEQTKARREDAVAPLLATFGKCRLEEFTESDARLWAAEHPTRLRYAKSMFKMAADDGLIARNPFRHLKHVERQRPVVPPPKEKLWAAIRDARAMSEFGEETAAVLLVAAGAGLRIAEICKLTVGDVLVGDELELRVRDGKGGVHRKAAVLEPFGGREVERAVLNRRNWAAAAGGDDEWLWPERPPSWGYTRAEITNLQKHDIQKLWVALRERAGLTCRFHDIRHFHATWLLDCGCTAEDVAIQLHGHPNPRTVIKVYGHPSHELARLRLRKLTRENGRV